MSKIKPFTKILGTPPYDPVTGPTLPTVSAPAGPLFVGVVWARTKEGWQPAFVKVRGSVAELEMIGPPEFKDHAREVVRINTERRTLAYQGEE